MNGEVGSSGSAIRLMLSGGILATLAILAVLLAGGTNAWAATENCPRTGFEKAWGIYPGKGLHAVDTDYGVDRFSILEPMTTDRLKDLPCGLKSWLAFARVDHQKSRLLRSKSVKKGNTPRLVVRPRLIAAWGHTTLSTGERVDVVSLNGKICLIERFHAGNCGKISRIETTGMAATTKYGESADTARTVGLVPDNVVSMTLEYPGFGDVPIKDNVFETSGNPDHRFFIIGRDAAGAVVTSVLVRRSNSVTIRFRAAK
ncbi:MAG: hypothetical protein QG596_578 [Actinomycetota bacterium]|jgi:hypothetical protein|nr:hypothetical protein [Actinomycetota bacterium]